jgi:hypothetical protein
MVAAMLAGMLPLALLGAVLLLRAALRRRRLAERGFAAAVADGDFELAELQAQRRFALQVRAYARALERWGRMPPAGDSPSPASSFWYLGPWPL